jgi:transposase
MVKPRTLTDAELATLNKLYEDGESVRTIMRALSIGKSVLRRYINWTDRSTPPKRRGGRPPKYTAAQQATVVRMANAGATSEEIVKASGLTLQTVYRIAYRMRVSIQRDRAAASAKRQPGPKSMSTPSKPKREPRPVDPVELVGLPGVRGSKHPLMSKRGWVPQIPAWVVPQQTGEIADLVTYLRRLGFAPVCAETTITRPLQIPKPYTEETLFRVGRYQNVTVQQLREIIDGQYGHHGNARRPRPAAQRRAAQGQG